METGSQPTTSSSPHLDRPIRIWSTALSKPSPRKSGQPLNGWRFNCSKGPRQVTIEAEEELRSLKLLSSQLRSDRTELPLASEIDPPTGYQWLKLIALLVVCIVGEALANVTLLTRALSTGLVGAFITAVLVSAINVGALGAGGGLILSAVRRNSKSQVPFLAGCGFLLVAATVLNLHSRAPQRGLCEAY